MRSLTVDRSLFQHVYSLIAPSQYSARATERRRRNNTIEAYQKEMMMAGNRLKETLRMERALGKALGDEANDEALEKWKACREGVEQIARDYALAVARWRAAVLETAAEEDRVWEMSEHQTRHLPG